MSKFMSQKQICDRQKQTKMLERPKAQDGKKDLAGPIPTTRNDEKEKRISVLDQFQLLPLYCNQQI